jgi:hypothetical protein
MLSPEAHAEFTSELRRLRTRLAELHMASLAAPLDRRRGTGVLLAVREWEPAAFRALRRTGGTARGAKAGAPAKG